ncbi:hypothetical protein [Brumicola pallidula]|nr:hypothetical protein [Glaciecola pallidula]
MPFKTANHYILSTLLLLALIFNQGLGMLSSANAMSVMQSYADEDTLAICTGTSVKWISAAIFYQSDDIVEIDAPSDTPEDLHEVSCIFAQFNDSPKDDQFCKLKTLTNDFVTPLVNITKRLFVATDYVNNFLARGPPAFL